MGQFANRHRGRFVEYVLDRPDVRPVWKHFMEHTFVVGLGTGKLPEARFKHYLMQDYLYLVWIIRGLCLALTYEPLHERIASLTVYRFILLEAMHWHRTRGITWSLLRR